MLLSRRVGILGIALLAVPVLSSAQGAQGQTQTQTPPPQTQQTQPPPQDPQKPPTYKESVVVSASKTEQQIVSAPATMSVIGERALSVAPSNSYADVLRSVPGLNVTQISAR